MHVVPTASINSWCINLEASQWKAAKKHGFGRLGNCEAALLCKMAVFWRLVEMIAFGVPLQINAEACKAEPCIAKLKGCVATSRALLAATEDVEEASQHLFSVTGSELTLAGQAYPPPTALRKAALSEFCTRILLKASELS